jgi:hypothetical protein
MITTKCKLSLAQIVRFLVVEPTHPDLNLRFDMGVAYLWLIILSVVNDIPVDSETLFDRLCEFKDQASPVFRRCSYG